MIYPFVKTVYNCKQATLLSIKKEEGKITMFERLKLSYHLMYCDPCRQFIHQWKILNANTDRNTEHLSTQPFVLSEGSLARMHHALSDLEKE